MLNWEVTYSQLVGSAHVRMGEIKLRSRCESRRLSECSGGVIRNSDNDFITLFF